MHFTLPHTLSILPSHSLYLNLLVPLFSLPHSHCLYSILLPLKCTQPMVLYCFSDFYGCSILDTHMQSFKAYPYMRKKMHDLSFWVSVASHGIVLSSSIHLPENLIVFLYRRVIFRCTYVPHFHYLLITWLTSRPRIYHEWNIWVYKLMNTL